jgi:hypothetical protein
MCDALLFTEKKGTGMKETKPSPVEMKALYKAADAFRRLAPWEWMEDSDVFGVQDPVTGKVGYCCILGALGEVFALVVYTERGLQTHLKIQNDEIEQDDPDLMFMQDCLMASFENKADMDKDDIRLIKRLNLNFRGGNAWPMFKRYKPGYFPWHFDRDEVLFMTDALEQSIEVCRRLLDDDDIVTPTDEGLYLVRVPVAEDAKTLWKDEWRNPVSVADASFTAPPPDELRVQRLKKSAKQSGMIWEIDFFYSPTPISEGVRPYYPYAMMIADHDTGFVYDIYLAEHSGCEPEFMEHFLLCMEKMQQIPKEILIRKEEAAALLGPCASSLQITIKAAKELPAVASAREGMMKHLESFGG